MKSKLLIVFALLLFTITGCEYFENSDTLDVSSIEVNINGLPVLPDSMTYVGWFNREVNGVKKYTKVFVMDANPSGSINYKSDKPLQKLQEAQEFNLTTEKKSVASDSNLVPSTRELLVGRFSEAASVLTIGSGTIDFSNQKAVFNLATPTNGPASNELSGVWFVDSLSTNIVAGLDLPLLYEGWIYEGWVQINGQYVSTGRFSDPKSADLYTEYSDSLAGYSFPGEDFLLNAPSGLTFPTDLSNAIVAVSIEYNDGKTHGTEPFKKIFEATLPASAQSGVTYSLQYTSPVLTSGNSFMVIDLVK
jgi:hypothetical protein